MSNKLEIGKTYTIASFDKLKSIYGIMKQKDSFGTKYQLGIIPSAYQVTDKEQERNLCGIEIVAKYPYALHPSKEQGGDGYYCFQPEHTNEIIEKMIENKETFKIIYADEMEWVEMPEHIKNGKKTRDSHNKTNSIEFSVPQKLLLKETPLDKLVENYENSLLKDTSLDEEFNLAYNRFEKQLKKEEGIEKLEEEISGFKEDYAIDEAYGYNPPSEKDIENLSRLEVLLDEKKEKINSTLLDFKNNNDPSILLKKEDIKDISLEEAKELVEKDNAPTPKLQKQGTR